ncbi:cysteine desulfurase family protein [Flammeovirgaceae bacterium SG7u.111]|nr:cysteine desulfurase family protein [Flammeovirgaceae bacterium SG7u.132]WPO35851.1 cysteine desulfurase family protein [Flammeovirgaceae bacterium SG7u.111]
MMKVYLDNAATTPLAPEVLDAMLPYMKDGFGNPSSTHSHGREIRAVIEKARKQVAELLGASPSEVFFTSGGTESDNIFIRGVVRAKQVQHIITSRIEHHAVLHTVEDLAKSKAVQLHYVDLDERGMVDYKSLSVLLEQFPNSLVSLMYGNNEIGNITDITEIGRLCKEFGTIFHSDTVQTVGHFPINLKEESVDAIVGSAHKFHGPKGVGFLYLRGGSEIPPMFTGGGQEREMRSGTENIYGIIGLAKALEISLSDLEEHKIHIEGLKKRMIDKLKAGIPGVEFNGCSGEMDQSLYTILNIGIPSSVTNSMLLFSLDLAGISVSGGSACGSGANQGSHVIKEISLKSIDMEIVRFSFSRYTTEEEVDYAVEKLMSLLAIG